MTNLEKAIRKAIMNGYADPRKKRGDLDKGSVYGEMFDRKHSYRVFRDAKFWSSIGVADWKEIRKSLRESAHVERFFEEPIGEKKPTVTSTVTFADCVNRGNLADIGEASRFFDKAFGFRTNLSMCRDYRKGFYQIYDARGRLESESQKEDFPNGPDYTWELLIGWLRESTPFDYEEEGKYLNIDFRKEHYENFMRSETANKVFVK